MSIKGRRNYALGLKVRFKVRAKIKFSKIKHPENKQNLNFRSLCQWKD